MDPGTTSGRLYLSIVWVDSHLDIGAASLHTHVADDGDGSIPQPLVLLVGQRLGWGDGDAVPYARLSSGCSLRSYGCRGARLVQLPWLLLQGRLGQNWRAGELLI